MGLTIKEIENAKPRDKIQNRRWWRPVSPCLAVGCQVVGLALPNRRRGKEHGIWGVPARHAQRSSRAALRSSKDFGYGH